MPMRILETVALTPHSTPPHRVIAMPIIRSFGVRSNVFSATAAPSPSLFAHRTPYTPHVSCSGSRSQTVRGRAEEVENLVHIRSDHRVRHGEDLVQRLAVPYFSIDPPPSRTRSTKSSCGPFRTQTSRPAWNSSVGVSIAPHMSGLSTARDNAIA